MFFLLLFFLFSFLFLKNRKKLVSPLKKGSFVVHSSVFPFVFFSLFGASSFLTFSFLLSLLFFSFFLPFCFSFLYFVLAFSFCFACFFFQAVLLFLFFLFCLLSGCFLNHNLRFVFALHLVFLLLLFFVFVAFIFVLFGILETYQNTSLKNMEIPKTAKIKNAEKKKRTFWQEQLAQVCSQIVSFCCFCVSFNFACFAENTIKIGVSPPPPPKKKQIQVKVKNWSKHVAQHNWTSFNIRNCVFFCVFFACFFFKNPLLSAGRMRFSKIKNGPVSNFKKGKHWTSF